MSLTHYRTGIFVIPHGDKFDVAYMVNSRPFQKLKPRDEFGLHPDTLFHFLPL